MGAADASKIAGANTIAAGIGAAGRAVSGFMSAIPLPGGSPGIGTGSDFGEIGTSGSDLADFGYTPAQDRAFHNGGIDYGWL